MEMVGEKDERMKLDFVQALGSREDSDGDGAELRGGAQKQPSLEGPSGDLDDSTAFWDEPDSSGHVGEPEDQELCQPGGLPVIFSEVQARMDLRGIPEESCLLKHVKRFGQPGDHLQRESARKSLYEKHFGEPGREAKDFAGRPDPLTATQGRKSYERGEGIGWHFGLAFRRSLHGETAYLSHRA